MKLTIELNIPSETLALDIKALFQEFTYLAKLRGWGVRFRLPRRLP